MLLLVRLATKSAAGVTGASRISKAGRVGVASVGAVGVGFRGAPGRAGCRDRDAVAAGVGGVELASGIESDTDGAVQPGVAAGDGGRGSGVPGRARRIDRDAVAGEVGDEECGRRDGGILNLKGRLIRSGPEREVAVRT